MGSHHHDHPHAKRPSVDTIIAELRRHGHRITEARRAIIALLCNSAVPLSAAQILAAPQVRKASKVKTTIYRELDFLMEQHLARSVDISGGKKHFELSLEDDHHHHLICTRCETVQCVSLPHHLSDIESDLERRHHFTIESHTLEFFGLCQRCSDRRKN